MLNVYEARGTTACEVASLAVEMDLHEFWLWPQSGQPERAISIPDASRCRLLPLLGVRRLAPQSIVQTAQSWLSRLEVLFSNWRLQADAQRARGCLAFGFLLIPREKIIPGTDSTNRTVRTYLQYGFVGFPFLLPNEIAASHSPPYSVNMLLARKNISVNFLLGKRNTKQTVISFSFSREGPSCELRPARES